MRKGERKVVDGWVDGKAGRAERWEGGGFGGDELDICGEAAQEQAQSWDPQLIELGPGLFC